MMMMMMHLESRRGSVRVGGWVGARARGGAREAVDGDLEYRISTLDTRHSNLESRHRTVVDSIRSIRSFDSFVRLAVTLARSVGTKSRERGDGGTTGANDDDESMDECLERLE